MRSRGLFKALNRAANTVNGVAHRHSSRCSMYRHCKWHKESHQAYSLGRKDYAAQYRYAANLLPILYNHNPFPLLLSSMEKAHSMRSPNERERRGKKRRKRNNSVEIVCICVALTNRMPIRRGPPETNLTSLPSASPKPTKA